MLRRRLSSTNVWLLTEKPNAESVFIVRKCGVKTVIIIKIKIQYSNIIIQNKIYNFRKFS